MTSTTRNLTIDIPIPKAYEGSKYENHLFPSTLEGNCGGLREQKKFKKNNIDEPVITIVTAVYNGIDYLENTILSVLNQSYSNIEYIIIDGGSSDGTLNIIKKYDEQIDYWLSESDTGIYNAWNKGLKLATGEIIAFLSAGDLYDINTIEKVNLLFLNTKEYILYGHTQKFSEEDGCTRLNKHKFSEKNLHRGFGFMHPSVFVKNETYKKVGLFDEKYKIAGDTDWMIRAFNMGISFEQGNHKVYMVEGGVSQKFHTQAMEEFYSSLVDHGFDKSIIKKLKGTSGLKDIIKKVIFYKNLHKMFQLSKEQLKYFLIVFYNFFYNYLPTFTLKNIFLNKTGVNIGNLSYIHAPILFFTYRGNVTLGCNTVINSRCYLDNRGHITIGNNVSISHDTKIYTAGHDVQAPCFDFLKKDVVIDDNVVIFANVLIMPGVHIEEGAVVFPGSVVTKNVKAYSVIGGNPAKFIKTRNKNQIYKLDHDLWFAI